MISHIGRPVSGRMTDLPESNEWSVALCSRFFVCEFRDYHNAERLGCTVHDKLNFPFWVLFEVNHGEFCFYSYSYTCYFL